MQRDSEVLSDTIQHSAAAPLSHKLFGMSDLRLVSTPGTSTIGAVTVALPSHCNALNYADSA